MKKVTIIASTLILIGLASYQRYTMETELTDRQIEENHEAQLLNELNR